MKLPEDSVKESNLLRNNDDQSVIADIYHAIGEIRYGSVQIHIQDGKIVQIDKINKLRLR